MRYIVKISYDGKNYFGFQKQKNKPTIQEIIENALYEIFSKEITLVASGRTDTGVSAMEQVCHIDIEKEIDAKNFKGYINSLLPKDIRVLDVLKVNEDFHARYSAKKKTYEYLFYTGSENPILSNVASYIGYGNDIDSMKSACNYFLGEHDFSSFCASNTSVKDKIRTIYDISITQIDENIYKLSITGNGFLYNMVRIIMGTLIDVGRGKLKLEMISQIIQAKDRQKAGKTAEAKGLYLKKVEY